MDALSEPSPVVGYYTQPYNEIVHPDRVWRVPKYFLRRWGPYLTPARFWAVVAARQLAYWNEKANWFTVYDRRFAQEACLSTIHFRRIKTEVTAVDQPLSLFLDKEALAESARYHVVNGQTKPRPTTYYVRLDDPLTPADAHHLAAWFQTHHPQRRAEAIVAGLQAARTAPRKELLAPALGPYLAEPPAQFRYLSVLDVIGRVYGPEAMKNSRVQEEAEALHSHLTGPDFYGKEYFRCKWLDILTPGPAFLIVYLRSLCFHDETTGERRDELSFTRPDLASHLGVTTKTLVNWLAKIAESVPEQVIAPFLTLLEQRRISSNDVLYTYRIEMLEPLVGTDHDLYQRQLEKMVGESAVLPAGKNECHGFPEGARANGKNEDHDLQAQGKNEYHDPVVASPGQGKNEDHDQTRQEILSTGHGNYEQGCEKKRWPFKYYETLIQSINEGETNPLLSAADWSPGWKLNNGHALRPFAQAVCDNDLDRLLDLLEVDRGGPARERMVASGLGINEIVAWYLYAASQHGLNRPPIHMVISRVKRGLPPPDKFKQLADLSWELWRCYAALLTLPPVARDRFRDAPAYACWMAQYGRYRLADLPLAVGEGVPEMMDALQYGREEEMTERENAGVEKAAQKGKAVVAAESAVDNKRLWQPVQAQLKLSMSLATYNTWLKEAVLLAVEEDPVNGIQRWAVGVRNQYAVEWLTNRLNKSVIEPLATSVHRQPIFITYVEQL
ncbi:MAG: hypothetical protein KF770_15600 [Anaerolineae bacterium]|nr:hypothetical protein [Anaerolineae bacterium]